DGRGADRPRRRRDEGRRDVGRGEERLLEGADGLEEAAGALGVELAQHVVEDQDRGVAAPRAHDLVFGDLQGEYRRALLTLRPERRQGLPLDEQPQLVAVRTDERR